MNFWEAANFILVGSAPIAPTDEGICTKEHPQIADIVHQFCSKTDISVPSIYAKTGVHSNDKKWTANIVGHCEPAQWIPQHYRLSQFFQMCAHHFNMDGSFDGASAIYGSGISQCQQWAIFPGMGAQA